MNMNTNSNDGDMEIVQPSALEAISNAEINQSIATARRFPRQLTSVKLAMMSFATLDQETAESCFYTLPRGGKNIQGPSVRLAEIAISCYGNLRVASRVISTVTTGDSPHVVIQAVAMDLEKNVSISIEKRRRIVGKRKAGGVIDEDDINLASNAGSAIALRDAVFKVVPLALIKPVFDAARKVAIGDERTLNDRRAKCMETFAKMGIPKERVLHKLEKKSIEDIGLSELETLIGFYNALKEGEVRIDEAFPPIATAATSDLKESVAPKSPAPVADRPVTPAAAPIEKPAAAPVEAPKDAPAEPTATPETLPEPAPVVPVEPPAETPSADSSSDALASVKLLAGQSKVSEAAVMEFCRRNKLAKPAQKELSDLAVNKLMSLIKAWNNIAPEIAKIQAESVA